MGREKNNQKGASRGQHFKTKTKPTVVKFKTKDGKVIQVRGVKTQKVDLGKKIKKK